MNIRRKCYMAFLGAVVMLLLPCRTVTGDSIAEPDYSFYGKHRSQIKPINRMFEANGSGGRADIYEEPGEEEPVIKMDNGSVFCVIHMYTDKKGDKWGSLLYDVQGNDTARTQFYTGDYLGWVKMEDLLVRYDEISFREEFGKQFQKYAGELDGYQAEHQTLYFWEYPGSEYKQEWQIQEEAGDWNIQETYRDDAGSLWGYSDYLPGVKGWICMTDPVNPDLPVLVRESVPASEVEEYAPGKPKRGYEFIIGGMILLVSLLTAVMIFVFWRRKKQS
ncbi:hypothetical protein [Lactonifactor longoviformis]|uniref:hypothetical protein n=1 Tax=Lactonifactor longoviformis TaxID=341220 RepID=UPI0036F2C204